MGRPAVPLHLPGRLGEAGSLTCAIRRRSCVLRLWTLPRSYRPQTAGHMRSRASRSSAWLSGEEPRGTAVQKDVGDVALLDARRHVVRSGQRYRLATVAKDRAELDHRRRSVVGHPGRPSSNHLLLPCCCCCGQRSAAACPGVRCEVRPSRATATSYRAGSVFSRRGSGPSAATRRRRSIMCPPLTPPRHLSKIALDLAPWCRRYAWV